MVAHTSKHVCSVVYLTLLGLSVCVTALQTHTNILFNDCVTAPRFNIVVLIVLANMIEFNFTGIPLPLPLPLLLLLYFNFVVLLLGIIRDLQI